MLSSSQLLLQEREGLQTLRRETTVLPVSIQIADKQNGKRKNIENHIARGFHKAYQAEITEFMPVLVGLGSSKTESALGIRSGREPLFVETYFNESLDNVLVAKGLQCPRHRLAEIGNLYSASARYTMPLLLLTAMALFKNHYSVLVFTATTQLQHLMTQNGLDLHYLAPAEESMLGEPKQNWGSYYATRPQVVAAKLADIVQLALDNPKVRLGYEKFAGLYPAFANEMGALL